MGERTSYEPGTFSWVDLTTPDPAGAKRFYEELFGWETEDMPAGDAGTYTMCRLRGHYVAALFEQGEDERGQGIPPHWNSYVTVAELDATAQRAGELGGTVIAPPMEVLTAGRMAVVQDPSGGVVSLWEPRDHIGAGLVNEIGCLSWNDLLTSDPDAAAAFYSELLGWSTETLEQGGVSYTVVKVGENDNGGILDSALAGGGPARWTPYFAVTNVDEAKERIESLGGRVVAGPTEVPAGRFAVALDPQGAAFSVFEGELDP